MQVARTAVAREPLSVLSVKTAAKMTSGEEARTPPVNPRLPSAMEAAIAVANQKAKGPAGRREHAL